MSGDFGNSFRSLKKKVTGYFNLPVVEQPNMTKRRRRKGRN